MQRETRQSIEYTIVTYSLQLAIKYKLFKKKNNIIKHSYFSDMQFIKKVNWIDKDKNLTDKAKNFCIVLAQSLNTPKLSK